MKKQKSTKCDYQSTDNINGIGKKNKHEFYSIKTVLSKDTNTGKTARAVPQVILALNKYNKF